jgi:cytidine deaminase
MRLERVPGLLMTDAASGDGAIEPASTYPELVICLCAAVGTDTREVADAFSAELLSVGYTPVVIRISSLMIQIPGLEFLADIKEEDRRISKSMHAGNEIRRIIGHADAMVRLALSEIHNVRVSLNGEGNTDIPAERHCFIVSSLKRAEELETLRRLFGQRVLLASVYEPRELRSGNLCRNIARSNSSSDPDAYSNVAEDLINTDQKEHSKPFGQRLEDVFQRADVFLKAGTTLRSDIRRFIQVLFGAPYLTPTVDEMLMLQARGAAQRSADLSRQVGAVIATTTGEILSSGCNEVPRAGGGVIWDAVAGTDRDYRDYKIGQDAAAGTRKEIVAELLEALANDGWLVEARTDEKKEERAQNALFVDSKPLSKTAVASLLEFGRIVHAEMAAICDAAMRGVAVRGSTLYCTTFPCHMCARHIVAAGITRVVYIEPYPKSRAKKLYKRAIRVDHDTSSDPDAVKFEAFVGIAPTRFFDLFEMAVRKDDQGYSLSINSPSAGPKGVASGSLSTELESTYVASIAQADWSLLSFVAGEKKDEAKSTVGSDEGRIECSDESVGVVSS